MNILKVAKKQAEKGFTHIDGNGEFVDVYGEKFEKEMRKEFISGVKDGSISMDISFNAFLENKGDESMIPIDRLHEVLFETVQRNSEPKQVKIPLPISSPESEKEGDNPC